MGPNSNTIRYANIIIITVCFIIIQKSCCTTLNKTSSSMNTHIINPSFLEDYLYKYWLRSISKEHHTGELLDIPVPSNFSGIKVAIVTLRSSTLWGKGANFSRFDIPPKAIKMHHVKRFAIMYENLGNYSSDYYYGYDLPGYTIVSSIIGFALYNATDLNQTENPQRLNFTISGKPIEVRFPNDEVKLPQDKRDLYLKKNIRCVRFDSMNGLIVLSNMSRPNVCLTRSLGQFAVAMPGVISEPDSKGKGEGGESSSSSSIELAVWKRWLIGFIVGFVGLMLLFTGFVICCKAIGLKKMARMERKAEKSEALETRWVGGSKMPSATVTRTQAVLENDLAP